MAEFLQVLVADNAWQMAVATALVGWYQFATIGSNALTTF